MDLVKDFKKLIKNEVVLAIEDRVGKVGPQKSLVQLKTSAELKASRLGKMAKPTGYVIPRNVGAEVEKVQLARRAALQQQRPIQLIHNGEEEPPARRKPGGIYRSPANIRLCPRPMNSRRPSPLRPDYMDLQQEERSRNVKILRDCEKKNRRQPKMPIQVCLTMHDNDPAPSSSVTPAKLLVGRSTVFVPLGPRAGLTSSKDK